MAVQPTVIDSSDIASEVWHFSSEVLLVADGIEGKVCGRKGGPVSSGCSDLPGSRVPCTSGNTVVGNTLVSFCNAEPLLLFFELSPVTANGSTSCLPMCTLGLHTGIIAFRTALEVPRVDVGIIASRTAPEVPRAGRCWHFNGVCGPRSEGLMLSHASALP